METLSPYGENKRALSLSIHKLVEVTENGKAKYFVIGKNNKIRAKPKSLKDLLDHFN